MSGDEVISTAHERVLREPVKCRGWQGCWSVDDATEHRVREQLA